MPWLILALAFSGMFLCALGGTAGYLWGWAQGRAAGFSEGSDRRYRS